MANYADPSAQALHEALGADHLASRIVNALLRKGFRSPSIAVLREQREEIAHRRRIGAMALKRIDALLERSED